MTEYSLDGKKFTEINEQNFHAYFTQAAEELSKEGPYGMTFLPMSKDINKLTLDNIRDMIDFGFDPVTRNYEPAKQKAYHLVLQRTLQTSFVQGNADLNSRLISSFGMTDVLQAAQNTIMNDSQKFNELDNVAKLSLLDASLARGDFSTASLLKNTTFDISKDDRTLAHAGDICTRLLARDKEASRDQRRQLPWELKAAILDFYTQAYGQNSVMLPTFASLMKDIHSSDYGDFSLSGRMKKLTNLAEKISKSFDFSNNSTGVKKYFPENWAEQVPYCDETQKLFYTCLYKLKLPEQSNFPYNSANFRAYQNARGEVRAQRELDYAQKFRQSNFSSDMMQLLAKYRPQELSEYKYLSPDGQAARLWALDYGISEDKRLKLMTQYITAVQEKAAKENGRAFFTSEGINFMLDAALKMKSISPEMKKFIQTVAPLVDEQTARYEQNKKNLELFSQKQEQKNKADINIVKHEEALSRRNALEEIYKQIASLRTDKETQLSDQSIEEIVRNNIAGKGPNKIVYARQSGLSSLFSGKKEKERQQRIEYQVEQINALLPELKAYKNIFIQVKPMLFSDEAFQSLRSLREAALDKQSAVVKEWFNAKNSVSEWTWNFVSDYERNSPADKLAKVSKNFVDRTKELKGKAREGLSFAYKGQEFTGESVFAEQKKSVHKAYKKKAEELRHKMNDAVKEEMSDRGVYEKPAVEDDGKKGQKISKKSADKVLRMMRDKKMYDKLSQKE